jgi:hypothetical protein
MREAMILPKKVTGYECNFQDKADLDEISWITPSLHCFSGQSPEI